MRLIPRRRTRPEGSMTVVEHLEELRRRLIISVAAVGLFSIIGFVFFQRILDLLLQPYQTALQTLPPELRTDGALAGRLVYSSPIEPFMTFLKVGLFTGFLVALPVLLWQLWQFITPGLTDRERRLGGPFVLVSVLLFVGGVWFAYTIIPRGMGFLLSRNRINVAVSRAQWQAVVISSPRLTDYLPGDLEANGVRHLMELGAFLRLIGA
jgi:sec-independent protein translocase protein TatC